VSDVNVFARSVALILMGTASLAAQAPAPPGGRGQRVPPGGGGLLAQAGSSDKHIVDPVAADRGKKTYIAECITCHGSTARGGPNGADLVRSLVVLHDRYGSQLGPFLKKGHPTQSTPSANLTTTQVADLADFIHQSVDDTLRTSPKFHAMNILTGDPKAGAAYFNGAGRCNTCHSSTGDLDRIDDFNVSLRDAGGEYHSWVRSAALKVKVDDPFLAHAELLDQYTDKNMHDITAYLETLK